MASDPLNDAKAKFFASLNDMRDYHGWRSFIAYLEAEYEHAKEVLVVMSPTTPEQIGQCRALRQLLITLTQEN